MSEQETPDGAEVEAHAKRFHAAEDAEPTAEDALAGTSREEADDQDVEAHAKRFHGAD